jgi:hypothetical protein
MPRESLVNYTGAGVVITGTYIILLHSDPFARRLAMRQTGMHLTDGDREVIESYQGQLSVRAQEQTRHRAI